MEIVYCNEMQPLLKLCLHLKQLDIKYMKCHLISIASFDIILKFKQNKQRFLTDGNTETNSVQTQFVNVLKLLDGWVLAKN